MNSYTLHITLYDLFFFGMIFIGMAFALLLAFATSVNRTANRFLALALVTMILWMARVLAIDVNLQSYVRHWDWLPTQFLLALGPLIYFYVLKITKPEHKFKWKDLLHFCPLVLEQAVLMLEINESNRTGADTYATSVFQQLNPVLQLLIFVSLITYLYKSHRLIENFYRRLQPVMMDRSRLEFRWLRRLLGATAVLWILWITYAAVDYFGYSNQLGVHVYYPFYIFFVAIIIWTAAAAFLKPQAALLVQPAPTIKASPSNELRQKAARLKRMLSENRYYEDPELSLGALAEKLDWSPHELSRIINTIFKKSFNDFINDYRIEEVIAKMQNPAYKKFTLLGIAFDSGFNSKTTFSRAFRRITGTTPGEYSNDLKKEGPSYKMHPHSRPAAIISCHEATPMWSSHKLNRNYMFRNYLKIAWRNMLYNKVYSALNIVGLAAGMAVALLIGLWVTDQYSYDRFLPDYARLYQVEMNLTSQHNGTTTQTSIALPLVEVLK